LANDTYGMRVSEVCALTWEVIDFDDGTAPINNGKGQVDHIVYFSPDVAQALRTWQDHQATGQYLFPSRIRKGAVAIGLGYTSGKLSASAPTTIS